MRGQVWEEPKVGAKTTKGGQRESRKKETDRYAASAEKPDRNRENEEEQKEAERSGDAKEQKSERDKKEKIGKKERAGAPELLFSAKNTLQEKVFDV